MAIKKSELYSSLWKSCDELRGDAAKLSVGLVGGSPTIAILSWQCSYIRQWLE